MARKQTDPNSGPETLWEKLFGRSRQAKQSAGEVREVSSEDQNSVRQYLLKQLSPDEQRTIEQRLLNEDDLFEELEIAQDELVTDYVAGRLSEVEVKQLKENFLATPEGSRTQRFAEAVGRYQQPDQKKDLNESEKPSLLNQLQQFFAHAVAPGSPLAVAAVALIIVGLGFGVWRGFFYQSDVDNGLLALNAAYREQRPLESRITQLNYAPFITTRGPGTDNVNERERQRAELTLLEALNKNPTPAVHHALGKVYLARKDFDRAIEQFEEALKGDPNSAQINADLGAAFLEKGKADLDKAKGEPSGAAAGNGGEQLGHSLEHLNKALTLNPNLLEALFNRALCHQYLGLTLQAKADWLEYLNKDSLSPWAAEAREHLKLLENQEQKSSQNKEQIFREFLAAYNAQNKKEALKLVSNYQNRSGNVVVEQLLDQFLAAKQGQEPASAEREVSILADIGNLIREQTGERFYLDLARYYGSAKPSQLAALTRARSLMQRAHAGWGQVGPDESLKLFQESEKLFQASGDVCEAAFARYWVSFCYFHQQNYQKSLAFLELQMQANETAGYKWLLVRSLYLVSGIHFALNEHSKAVSFADRSLSVAETLGDTVGMINALTSLIEYHRYLGNYQKSLAYIEQSLPLVNSISLDPFQGCRHYGFEAAAFASISLFAAAGAFQREALRYAVDTRADTTMSFNYAFMGMVNGKLANYHEALGDAEQAFSIAAARSSESRYRNLMAYASLQLGDINRAAGNFDDGIRNYDRAIALYEELSLPTHLYQAHKGKLLCALNQQNDALSQSEIALTLKLLEDYRHKISEESQRNKFFDTEQGVYDAAINFEAMRMNNSEAAFTYSELSKARSLLGLMGADALVAGQIEQKDELDSSKPLSLSEIKLELPEQIQIVQYAVLSDKLVIWLISRAGMSSYHQPVAEEELTRKILDYLNLIATPPGSSRNEELRLSHDLYNLLIRPIETNLNHKQICIIPDKILNLLPFAALVSPASGRYLIEDNLIQSSPSASVFMRATAMARNKGGSRSEKVLSVGNPNFDRKLYQQLSDLPAATTEAQGVAASYLDATTFVNDGATKDAVRSQMENSDVIHFALHSDIDERFPLRSKLIFANTNQPAEDTLSAYEIYHSKFPRTRVVVLSSCRTAAEQYYRGEGMMSLARSFLVAGVPLVVASLWPVESNSTTELMTRFHRLRNSQKISTAAALRSSQLEMLRDPDSRFHHPYYWAPFTVIGGYAEF